MPAPVPFSGSASTDLEVKGPPKLDVTVSHPDFVQAGVPYDLTVRIENTDPDLDGLYASMALDVGAGADLLEVGFGVVADAALVGPAGAVVLHPVAPGHDQVPVVQGQRHLGLHLPVAAAEDGGDLLVQLEEAGRLVEVVEDGLVSAEVSHIPPWRP